MPEHVTGSDLRARADGLKTVIEGDANTFDRGALVAIVDEIRRDLQAAANTLEAHELHRRQTEHPQHNGAGSDDPNPGGAPRDHAAAGGVGPGIRTVPPEAKPADAAESRSGVGGDLRAGQAEAASDDKPHHEPAPAKAGGKDKVEK